MSEGVSGMTVGIEAISAYCGSAYVDVEDLFEARGLDRARIANLGMRNKSVAAPGEDVVAMAATAARPLTDALTEEEKATVRAVIVATESAFDLSKAASTYVHRLLELPRTCRLLEVKEACYGGIAALQMAAALVAVEPESRVLVIASDLPGPNKGTYAEPAQGAGAVAVLVGARPRVVELTPGTSGCYGYEITDFARPRADVDVVDTDLSLMAYLECLRGAFLDYASRVPGADFARSFDLLAMHTPFPGMVRGAHRTGLRKLSDLRPGEVQEDFTRRVEPSLRFPREVGNVYAATTLLAMSSAIAYGEGERLGVFSYGSGCSSEFFGCRVPSGAAEIVESAGFAGELTARRRLTVAEYDEAMETGATTMFGACDAKPEPDVLASWGAGARPRAVLTTIQDYRREYTWLPAR
ncbi:hydroxymethylglutaryl-CoA synthase [Actinomadura sp. DC4]|uniref:hydroxymethylglutaryl-CoA synthase family protein n=1 Tax=Actinomadura sp. DC4 TaxID=3055069 RepID=UPI0025B19B70|nr:hydroxymethylglutaryl-CoA synthase [Actinomadura sp. DC4]MDN3354262.1 hydroxymethylglutaryl-CoA synthase [Actinomadura sp. DC4]